MLGACVALSIFSDFAGGLPEEHEWANLHGRGQVQVGLCESTVVPEIEPLEVVGSELDIILVPVVLEEKHLVTPLRASGLRTRN